MKDKTRSMRILVKNISVEDAVYVPTKRGAFMNLPLRRQSLKITSSCTVPVSSSTAYGKLITAPLSAPSQFQVQWLIANSQQHLFLYSPSFKFNGSRQTHSSTFFCTVPVSSSIAYGKLITAPLSAQSQFQVQWLIANSQQHLFLYSPSFKFSGSRQTHSSTFFCTVPVSS